MLAGRGMSLAGPEAGNSLMPDLILAALSIIAASSIAVNWHRYILRDETPKTLAQAMRLDAPVWRYAGYTVFALFIVLFPVIVLLNISLQITILLPLVLLASFFGGIMFMRLSVALPAKALEQPGFGLRQALEATRGNMGSFAGIILVNAAIVIATLLVMGLLLSIILKLPSPISVIAIALGLDGGQSVHNHIRRKPAQLALRLLCREAELLISPRRDPSSGSCLHARAMWRAMPRGIQSAPQDTSRT